RAASPLRPLDYAPDTFSTRSPEAAYALATQLARRAQREPERFAQLARAYSDDVLTRGRGGSLAVRTASELPAAFLDAVELMEPGDVSNVVATPLGFHLLLRRQPPPRDEVAGQQVLIRYASTFGDVPSVRSRAAALALAQRVLAEAREGSNFDGLVARYSEANDRERGGVLGATPSDAWSEHAALLEALAELPRGGLLDAPIETYFGFHVARRIAAVQGPEYAVRLLRVPYVAGVTDAESTARAEAARLAARLTDDQSPPGASDIEVIRWREGRGDAHLTGLVEQLAIDAVTPTPVLLHGAFAVFQRVSPQHVPALPAPLYVLPTGGQSDVEGLLKVNSGPQVAVALTALHDALLAAIPPASRALTGAALQALQHACRTATSAEQCVLAYRAGLSALHRQLPAASYARLTSAIQRWVDTRARDAYRP
ncbi:MAG TPA: peptidylprolyl isomerase, partial [Polyangiales bacterium]